MPAFLNSLLTGKSDDANNAIVKKVVNGHLFEATLLLEPTKCAHCNQHIWIPHGHKCKFCRFSSHSKCLRQINTPCKGPGSSQTPSQGLDGRRQHRVEETSVMSGLCNYLANPKRPDPLCDHCGTCIVTLTTLKYQKCSQCARIFHKDCEKLVSSECDLGQRLLQDRDDGDHKLAHEYDHTSRLTIESFEILGLLGKGSFSTVYLAKLKDTKYAVKVIEKTNSIIISNPEYAFTEWRALNLGRSYPPFLTVGHCCFQSRDRLYFVMEYVHGRDLLYHVRNEAPFREERTQFHAAEVVLALIYLHRQHVVYRDLKLNNIMLDPNGHCKLIDFGLAKYLPPDKMKTNTFIGTPYYLSPEVLEGKSYDFSVDWWALGVIIYEMLCAHQPFTGDNNEEIFEAIKTRDVRRPANVTLSGRALNIIDGLLKKKPNERLGCQLVMGCSEEILRHSFFLFQSPKDNSLARGEPIHLWEELEAKQVKPPYIPDLSSLGEPERVSTQFKPISSKQVQDVPQNDFDNFSSYSESFTEELSELADR